jgi:hypothetical protein
MKVAGTEFSYNILIGKTLPIFTYVPGSFEIIHRLILKACFVTDID